MILFEAVTGKTSTSTTSVIRNSGFSRVFNACCRACCRAASARRDSPASLRFGGDRVDHQLAGATAGGLMATAALRRTPGTVVQHPLDLRRADLDPAQVHGVVHPAQRAEIPAGQPLDLIAVPAQQGPVRAGGVPAK